MKMDRVIRPLDPAIGQEIQLAFKQAVAYIRSGDKVEAARVGVQAWEKMPSPIFGWDTSLSNLRVLVRILRESGEYQRAIDVVNQYLHSGFHLEYEYHPYFLLGTIHFAEGEMESARRNFQIADSISEGRCFVDEKPEYRRLLKP